jgi:type I restriction enzyme S subunit
MKEPFHFPYSSLGEIFQPIRRKNAEGVKRVLTVSGEHGLVDQTEFFDRDIASKDLAGYWLLKKGEFTYNRSFMKGYPGGAIKQLSKYPEGCVSPVYLCFALANDACDAEYYSHVFESGIINKQLMGIVQAGARAHGMLNVAKEDFFALVLPKPEIAEQKKIARILSTWDRTINLCAENIYKKRNEYAAFRQKYLTGKEKIPGLNGKWERTKLADVLTEHREVSTGKEEVCSVSVNRGVINQFQHLGRVYAAADTSNYNLVKPGDIVYTKSPTGDFPFGIVKQSLLRDNVIVSPLYGVFTPASFALGTILDCYFESYVNANNYLRPIIHKGAKNTINITNKTFVSQSLVLPSELKDQKAVARIILIKRKEIELLEQLKEKYVQQKTGLMQKLLTGKIRVKL